jgi:hypothetical protein
MKIRWLWWFIAVPLVVLYWACQPPKNPVNLIGDKVAWEMLAGEWRGEYFSKDSGRSGTIEFALVAEENKAFGDVLMIPRGSKEPYHPIGYNDKAHDNPRFPELLTIQFVEIVGERVRGELTPYWDPEMQRRMHTIFEGIVKKDSIQGTFESRIEQSPIYFYGQWEVFRKKK